MGFLSDYHNSHGVEISKIVGGPRSYMVMSIGSVAVDGSWCVCVLYVMFDIKDNEMF